MSALAANPLYDPRFEHDACGLGLIARADGARSRELVERALAMLAAMEHRGARGADPDTGDGAGLMLQVPDRLLRRFCRAELELELPPPGRYAVAMCFLPTDPALRLRCEELCVRIAVEEGQQPLGWRDVPRDSSAIGRLARESEPVVRQLLVAQGPTGDERAFRRKLTVIRRRVELAAAARRVPEATFHIASFSSSTLTYKGLLTARQLPAYYADLREPEIESAMALVHSRFSTNTLGSWDLAHPFHYLAHNGEINTVRGNRQWMHAREPQLRSAQLGDDLPKLFPLIDERWSDSAALDAAFELLVLAGRAPAHALAMLIPAAWSQATPMADDVRAFYEFHAGMLEPWDGPAAVAFCDGRQAGATLDRNGLRPCRYQVTRDGLLVLASEAGVLELDPAEVVVNDRLRPGQMLIVDTDAGRIRGDEEIKNALARRRPYRALLDEQKIYLEDIPSPPVEPPARDALEHDLRLFGYSDEELRDIVAPMARDGQEPIASMGVDTPLAALSRRPRLLRGFFKQLFAQVTNPAIDPQRETLVMSLRTAVGAQGNLLDESPDHARRLAMAQPVLTSGDLAKLRALPRDRFRTITLECTFDARGGGRALERALDALCRRASRAIALGEEILVLSDRSSGGPEAAPIPALLATAAVHSHLVREGWRTKCGLIVESGEPREVMDFALLVGFGAAAVNPYVALDLVAAQWSSGGVRAESAESAQAHYVQAIGKGLLKVLSKMGVSTVMSYRGAQLFECVGLSADVVARYFTATPSRVGGIGLEQIAADVLQRLEHARAGGELDPGGVYAYRLRGERHVWNPEVISTLQRAVRDERPESYRAFAEAADAENRAGGALRGLLELVPAGEPLPLSEVEPSSEIVRRFASGAMSLGSISKEAHETLAIALNRLGGRSNSGEGGEDARRSQLDAAGDSRRSAIKQVASARFGVTTAYLVDADVLQIKVSQGAKPGEGGQLPGHKVDAEIARLRHSTPGVGLISPPPHHDIYSIEDLAQLIHDLRCANPTAEISVKLVALAGVGTVAAGVAKAGADHIVIAGMDGGTGASPASSIRHAGVPWELGLAESQQVLVGNDLRGRVRLQVDGGLRTGFDVVVGALLGAEEFGFSTAPLVAAGCIMMRVCHLNTCPVGIATQDPELRRRFAGTPEHVVQYLLFVAEEVRELMARMGVQRFDDLVGRTDLARQISDGGAGIDLGALLSRAVGPEGALPRFGGAAATAPAAPLDREVLELAGDALGRGERITVERSVRNTDRAIGTLLSGEIVRRLGPDALADGALTLRLSGTAGQSLGAWGIRGLVLDLQGQANDYAGKGLSGARIVVRPPAEAGYEPRSSIAVGNTTLYGATSGELFVRGRAGERFAVRNSGATAVVEGVGRHGCEYMTGGLVAVLGPVGRNFAAGMSGGIAYLWDPDGENTRRVNSDMVLLRPVSDDATLRELVERHQELTGSDVAEALLADWDTFVAQFVEVMPHDLLRIAAERDPELEGARGDARGFLEVQRRLGPLRAPLERLGDYRDVHLRAPEEEVRDQARRCMSCGVPFCHQGCPLGNLIPDWNDLVHRGGWQEASERLHSTNSFPELTGKLCPAPCEEACVLTINDDAVAIKEIEWAIVERAWEEGWIRPQPADRSSGKSVGVVGSGPAGLAAAQQLARAGHAVTVYERDDRAGGLLRYGIPDFKLEKSLIDRRVEQLVAEGVEFALGIGAGADVPFPELRERHDALVLATGAQHHRPLTLPGAELAGVHLAMEYLVQQNRRVAGLPVTGPELSAKGLRVAILGGGDTSADCLGNVLREGCASVVEIAHGPTPPRERSPQRTWPEWPFLLRTYPAHEEGGDREWQLETYAIEGDAGHVQRLRARRVEFPGFAETGLRRPIPVQDGEVAVDIDLVLVAIGFTGVESDDPLYAQLGLELGSRATLPVDAAFATPLPGVFAAGDCVRGADLIVQAIADGREAARSVDLALQGASALPSRVAV